ncbi:heparinase II/III family protein [Paenibacillus sp. HB172176]|uniref:heparinase II/III family protein n=1 Tax=Paenibacillus sp. HB172176 TaxID=2493690 RepID=UPI00143B96E8|nr:heparinase II/III family protein [Paenibacillus sp. HB172176]
MISFRSIRRELTKNRSLSGGFPYGVKEPLLERITQKPHLGKLLREIRDFARIARETGPPALTFQQFHRFEEQGTRQEYEEPYFDRRGRLLALVLDCHLEGHQDNKNALENLIWDICNEYTWCLPACLPHGFPAAASRRVPPECEVDLFAAETAHALAETLYLVGEWLNPWLGYRIRTEIERRVFRPLFHDPVPFDWESRANNWSAVCGGAVGMAALLLETDKERLSGMIDRVVRSLECFLEGFGEDGGCAEGVGYWFYGFGYYAYFADMLYQYTDGDLDLLADEKIRAIAAFPAAVALSGGKSVNYSDVGGVTLHTGLLSRLAQRLGSPMPEMKKVPKLRADECYRWAHVTRNLLWTDASLFGKASPEGESKLEHLAVAVERRRSGNTMFAFSAKGGHNDEPHNHNDLGHFILHVGGENLLADPGAGLYTRDYFGEKRYELIHNSSEGHSVPVVDGRLQQAGRAFEAQVLRWYSDESALAFELDLTRAYDALDLQQFVRRLEWRWQGDASGAKALLTLDDSFQFGRRPGELVEQFVSLHPPLPQNGEYIWRGSGGFVSLQYDNDAFDARVITAETTDFAGRPQIIYRLQLRALKPAAQMENRFLFRCFAPETR